VSSSLTHRLSITDAAATAAFPSSFLCVPVGAFRLFTPNWYLGRVTACSGCATTSYTIDPISFYSSGSISQSARAVYVHTHIYTRVGRVLGAFSFHLDYCLAFFIFCNAAPQAKGWPWIMGPVEPIGAMRRAPRFAFINWQHELNIGLLLSVSDFEPTSLCRTWVYFYLI
jgi:hypothetical protein